jgi:hypothetical protein
MHDSKMDVTQPLARLQLPKSVPSTALARLQLPKSVPSTASARLQLPKSVPSTALARMSRAQLESFANKIDILAPQDMDVEELRDYLQRRSQHIPQRILRSALSSSKRPPTVRTNLEKLSFDEILQKLELYGVSTAGISTKQEALEAASRAISSSFSTASSVPSAPVEPTFTVDFNLLEDLPMQEGVDGSTSEPLADRRSASSLQCGVNILQGVSKCALSQQGAQESTNCLHFAMTSSKKTLLRTLGWTSKQLGNGYKGVHKDATFDDLVQCYLWIRSIDDKKIVSPSRFSAILHSSKRQLRQNLKSSKQHFIDVSNEQSPYFGCTTAECANFLGWILDLRMQDSVIDRMDWAVLVLICGYGRVPRVVNIEEFSRYQRLSNMGGEYLYKLTEAVYPEYFNGSLLTPARYLALKTPSFLEDELPCCSLDAIGEREVANIASRIGMVIPDGQDPVQYFWRELFEYRDVETDRKEVPNVCGMSMDEAMEVLRRYPDEALMRFAEQGSVLSGTAASMTSSTFDTRQQLLEQVYSGLTSTNSWRTTANGVQHIHGDDVEYFTFEELSNAFREARAFVSPNTGEEFAVESMNRLLEALDSSSSGKGDLAFIIRDLLSRNVQRQDAMQEFTQWFAAVSEERRKASLQFAAWLFRLGMYCRGWKGPGMPYPARRSSATCVPSPSLGTTPVCNQRGERQRKVCECLRQRKLFKTGLPTAMTAIPVLSYDFATGNVKKGEELFRFLDALEDGEKRLMPASNKLIETSYFFLRYVARLTPRELQDVLVDNDKKQYQPPFNPAEYKRIECHAR